MKVKTYLEEIFDKQIEESRMGIYGKKKSPVWLKLRQRIFSSKTDKELTKLMKEMEKMHKQKKLDMTSFMDLIDKVDMHKQKINQSHSNSTPVMGKKTDKAWQKMGNKIKNK